MTHQPAPHPPFLLLNTEAEYRAHYEREYCLGVIHTHDGYRVYFPKEKFNHAFFESGVHGKAKTISDARVQRMPWIAQILADPNTQRKKGWDKDRKTYDDTRRAEVHWQDFVVVIEFGRRRDGAVRAKFVTCYVANQSIDKLNNAPPWDAATCLAAI